MKNIEVMRRVLLGYMAFLFFTMPLQGKAQEGSSEAGEAGTNRMALHGYARTGMFGAKETLRHYYTEGEMQLDFSLARRARAFTELRYRLEKSGSHWEAREVYVDFSYNEWDVRIGQQIFQWGRADGYNPTNCLSPQDLSVYSPDYDDKRMGRLAARITYNFYPLRRVGLATCLSAISPAHRSRTTGGALAIYPLPCPLCLGRPWCGD